MKDITKEKLVNEKEVACILGVSVHFLQKMRRMGGFIPYRKISSSVRYSLKDVEYYLQTQSYTSTSQYKGGIHE